MDSVSEYIVYPNRIGEKAERILKEHSNGRIIMVSSKGWYLAFDNEIVIIYDEAWGLVSFGITVCGFEKQFAKNKDLENAVVKFNDGVLSMPGMTIDLRKAETNPDRNITISRERLRKGENDVTKLVRATDKGYMHFLLNISGIMEENAELHIDGIDDIYASCTAERMKALIAAVSQLDEARTKAEMLRFIGLGRGLTPSADDWMIGFLYTIRALDHENVSTMLSKLLRNCAEKCTNSISAAYLLNCADNGMDERIQALLKTGNSAEAEKILAIGSSSGADMLVGYLFALKFDGVYGEYALKRVKKN